MKSTLSVFLLMLCIGAHGQAVTFTNYGVPRITFGKDTFYSSRIHEITLYPDSIFEFWCRPHISCLTWRRYGGTFSKENDTLFFHDKYEVDENDVRATYKADSRQLFLISFKTDKNSTLRNKEIKVQYVYDYDAHIDEPDSIFNLTAGNTLEIPFKVIPYLHQLAAIRIEYQLNAKEKRYQYLTKNNPLNRNRGDIPNLISVEFVESPKKEIVHRTIKGIIRKDTLVIVSTAKTKTTLPDYHDAIEFEDGYTLHR